jgi:hypothetical protein
MERDPNKAMRTAAGLTLLLALALAVVNLKALAGAGDAPSPGPAGLERGVFDKFGFMTSNSSASLGFLVCTKQNICK